MDRVALLNGLKTVDCEIELKPMQTTNCVHAKRRVRQSNSYTRARTHTNTHNQSGNSRREEESDWGWLRKRVGRWISGHVSTELRGSFEVHTGFYVHCSVWMWMVATLLQQVWYWIHEPRVRMRWKHVNGNILIPNSCVLTASGDGDERPPALFLFFSSFYLFFLLLLPSNPVYEAFRTLSFSFSSFISPTILYWSSL
jgi:hypothetical protein